MTVGGRGRGDTSGGGGEERCREGGMREGKTLATVVEWATMKEEDEREISTMSLVEEDTTVTASVDGEEDAAIIVVVVCRCGGRVAACRVGRPLRGGTAEIDRRRLIEGERRSGRRRRGRNLFPARCSSPIPRAIHRPGDPLPAGDSSPHVGKRTRQRAELYRAYRSSIGPICTERYDTVGYLSASIRSVADARVGDTITHFGRRAASSLPGYEKATPMVFCGLFPVDADQ
ncbi:hypothetical protein BHE74_00007193 [Ensete ventricosum]|nr:hypothetical protein BHE74_00007193 [Ensete ventricosum]